MHNQVFISYRQESPAHSREVRRLGELLRAAGLPVVLDQFLVEDQPGGPDEGWPKWCEDCANDSACVLVIGSAGWFAAYDKTGPPGLGLGAAVEASLFQQYLYDEKIPGPFVAPRKNRKLQFTNICPPFAARQRSSGTYTCETI